MGASRITQNLYMGSRPPPSTDVRSAFAVIVLCAKEFQPNRDLYRPSTVVRVPMNDAFPTDDERRRALAAGSVVAGFVRGGAKTLVTCRMGWNRSGLVTGLALMALGDTVDTAVRRIRMARGPDAMGNRHFVAFMREYEGRIRPAA